MVALFDFPGQTAEDLSFQKGALIRVTEHVDSEWLRGRLDGREGLFPASFAQGRIKEPPVYHVNHCSEFSPFKATDIRNM